MVGQIVTGHGRQHHIGESQGGDSLGHPLCFGAIEGVGGLALVDLAEGATAGADRPSQQKGGRTGGIALGPVGAAPLLADGVQALLLHHTLHPRQLAGGAHRRTNPAGEPFGRRDRAVARGLCHHSTARRPSKARARVTSSAYSSSLPIGKP